MRCVLLLGLRPVPWARMEESERDRAREAVERWFESLGAEQIVRFQTWKKARTVRLNGGVPGDAPGPLLAGPPDEADAVIVACVVVEARSLKAAVTLAGTWPVPDAVVEVRPLE